MSTTIEVRTGGTVGIACGPRQPEPLVCLSVFASGVGTHPGSVLLTRAEVEQLVEELRARFPKERRYDEG
jgi:hypothetical protein